MYTTGEALTAETKARLMGENALTNEGGMRVRERALKIGTAEEREDSMRRKTRTRVRERGIRAKRVGESKSSKKKILH